MKPYMKTALCCCLLFASLWSARAAEPYREAFDKGNEFYAQEHYAQAIEQYENALQSGYESWEVFFNIGNAYYRSGNYPKAILYYERAAKRTHKQDAIQANLALAESKIADRFDQMPPFFLTAWWNNLVNMLSPTAWAILLLALCAPVLASLCLFFLGNASAWKKLGFYGFIFCFLLLMVCGLAAFGNHRQEQMEYAVVMCPSVEAKNSPEERSRTKLILHEGSKVLVEDHIGSYGKVRIKNGSRAWIPMDCVEKI